MMNIAFHIKSATQNTTEGINHLESFIHALRKTYGHAVRLTLVTSAIQKHVQDLACRIPCDEIILWKYHRDSEAVLKQHKIDALFGRAFGIHLQNTITISWLPDFRYQLAPETIGEDLCRARHQIFSGCAEHATYIALMSESTKKDFEAFFPKHALKGRVLKTTSSIPYSLYSEVPMDSLREYALPEKFIYVPIQWWRHKNHISLFHAMRILNERGVHVTAVATGITEDPFAPDHYQRMLDHIREWGISDQMKVLGIVPRTHVFQLIRQSVCVVNPSLFEGFGLSANEAYCIGKHSLLSDIPPHREQVSDEVTYFDPHDPKDLADKLSTIYTTHAHGPDFDLERDARCHYDERLRLSAESFMSIVNEAIAVPKG